MIEDMENNLNRDLDTEKREREENHESFVNLLEETCVRIEKTIGV